MAAVPAARVEPDLSDLDVVVAGEQTLVEAVRSVGTRGFSRDRDGISQFWWFLLH